MVSKLHIQGHESVVLRVSHSNIKSFPTDIRFSLQSTVEATKEKLWRKYGTSVEAMKLELYDDTGVKVSDLSDNMRALSFYDPQDGCTSLILVEKYKISDESYGKLDGTFKKFKEKFQHQHPNAQSKVDVWASFDDEAETLVFFHRLDLLRLGKSLVPDNNMEDLCASIGVGDRCQVEPGEKRVVIKFV